VLGSTDCAPKAGLETAFGTVLNAISTCIAQANAIAAKVPAFPALTDNTGGTSGAGTVGAVTVSVTAAGTALASAAGTNAVVKNMRQAVFQLGYFVNKLAVATGTVGVTGTRWWPPTWRASRPRSRLSAPARAPR
jgi:hypothetical protein